MEKTTKNNADANVMEKPFPRVEEMIENSKSIGSEYWSETKVKAQHLLDEAQSQSQKTWKQTKNLIQKYPAQAIGIAILFGAALSLLLKPKQQD